MKIRKTIAAGVAAVAMTFAGTSVAAAETTDQSVTAPSPQDDTTNGDTTDGDTGNDQNDQNDDNKEEDKGSSITDADPDEIKAWIGVVTAAVTALGAIFALVAKYFPINL